MDRLWTEMPGRRSGVHQTQVRKLNLGSSGNADLERGRALRLKCCRAAISGSCRRTGYDNAGTRSGRAVHRAHTRVIAHRSVCYRDVVGVGAPRGGICGIHCGGTGNPIIRRLHRKIRREIGYAGCLDV